jgi:hypothetical protein
MKTKFDLENVGDQNPLVGSIEIIGKSPKNFPYVSINDTKNSSCGFLRDKDRKTFAVNLLKALGYKVTLTKE